MKRIYYILILMTALVTTESKAQYGPYGSTDAKSMGMANTYTASATGAFAIGKNPAMICHPTDEDSTIHLLMPNIAMQFYTNSISFDEINNYFGSASKRYLTEADKNKLWNYFGNNGKFYFDATGSLFSIVWTPSRYLGSFALSVDDFFSGYIFLPQDMIDLSLKGNEIGRTYSFDDFELQTAWLRSISLSYSRDIFRSNGTIKNISSGVTAKLIQGYAHVESMGIESQFYTGEKHGLTGSIDALYRSAFSDDFGVSYDFDSTNKKRDLGYFSSPAGYGFGFDLGFAAETNYGLTIGFAIADIGTVRWTENAAKHRIYGDAFVDDITDNDKLDSLIDLFDSKSSAVDHYETKLPMTIRIGAALEISRIFKSIPGYMLLTAGFNQGLVDEPLTTLTPRVSIGGLWKPISFLPYVSTGFTYDQTGAVRWSGGIGYEVGFFHIGMATYDLTSLISGAKESPHLSFAMQLSWNIDYSVGDDK